MGPLVSWIIIMSMMNPEVKKPEEITPDIGIPHPTIEAIEPVEEASLEKLDVDALLDGEMQITIVKADKAVEPDVKCIEVDPERPLECIHKDKRCLLIDGEQKFCKPLPKE